MPQLSAATEVIGGAQIKQIVHPTDCSPYGTSAFAHALRIAIATKADLCLLHVPSADDAGRQPEFPQPQRLLDQWGMIDENNEQANLPASVAGGTSARVTNITVDAQNPVEGISRFISSSTTDLVVMATLGRDGLEHWLKGSIAESAFRRFSVPTLFINSRSHGFVQQVSGDMKLRRVLIPIDHGPSPEPAIEYVWRFCRAITGYDVKIELLHVGSNAPVVRATTSALAPLPVMIRYGNVVNSILDAALEYDVDLIGMPTAGHHGILDGLRGSTTERVLRQAPCAVLAIPAA